MKYAFLSKCFYSRHVGNGEILKKSDRPYAILMVKIEGLDFGVPLRSNINHRYAFMTDKINNYGVDYSKAVVIQANDIDSSRAPYIRPEEHKNLKGKGFVIQKGLEKFIKTYKKALAKPNVPMNKIIITNSTLQYFHKELGI